MLIEVNWDCLEGNHGYCDLEGCKEVKGVVWQRKVVWKHLLWMAKFVGVGVSGRSRLGGGDRQVWIWWGVAEMRWSGGWG